MKTEIFAHGKRKQKSFSPVSQSPHGTFITPDMKNNSAQKVVNTILCTPLLLTHND